MKRLWEGRGRGRGRIRIRYDSIWQATANSVEMAIGGAERESLSEEGRHGRLLLSAIEKRTSEGQAKVRRRRRRRRRRWRWSKRRGIS